MKILFIGDVSGRPGRETVASVLPSLRKQKNIDLVIANAENSAGGLGLTIDTVNQLMAAGVDMFTSGDHVWKQKGFQDELLDTSLPVIRPANYEAGDQIPGKPYEIIDRGGETRVVVINLLGQVFMRENVRNPFWYIDELLSKLKENENVDIEKDIIFVDFHAEATAEKLSLGYYLKDKVSAVVGTHTHVPTADHRIIGDTAYVTDVGMVGPLDASLWASFESTIHNFKFPFKKAKKMEYEGRRVFNSVLIDFSGSKATSIERIDKVLES